MKVVGGAPAPETYWRRWERLQRTGSKIAHGLPYPRGVYRFSTFEEADAWQDHHRLFHPVRPKAKI